jgi:hypothetical protein
MTCWKNYWRLLAHVRELVQPELAQQLIAVSVYAPIGARCAVVRPRTRAQ